VTGESVRLGRIGGIRIGAHWTTLVLVWLLAFSLADVVLPDAAPGHGAITYWVVAVGAAVGLFACLTLHELAHSIVARRSGIEIEGITLWLFGGVSRMATDPQEPGIELRMALSGPATSVGLGLGLAVVAGALSPLSDLAAAAVAWLAVMNGMLGLFNLLPAFPLDGGRVLRAWLWRRHGDLRRATATAAGAGRVVGYGLIGLGVLGATSGGGFGMLWLAFIGWYLLAAATAEAAGNEARALLGGVRVADVMARDPVVVGADLSVDDLLHGLVLAHRYSSYPVVDLDGRALGIVTLDGVRTVDPARRRSTPVGSIMVPVAELATATPDEPLVDLLARGGTAAGGRALVLAHDRVVGVVTPVDVQRCLRVAQLVGT
jgi:Zn-dependent protease